MTSISFGDQIVADVPLIEADSYFFKTIDDAIAWRESLTPEQEQYLYDLDKHLTKMHGDEVFDVDKKVKPENRQLFYRCMSYITIGCSRVISFSLSDDYSKFRKLHTIEVYSTKDVQQGNK